MTNVEEVKGVGVKTAAKLKGAGINSAEKLAHATVDEVVALGIGKATAGKIINNAKDLVATLPAEEPVEEEPIKAQDEYYEPDEVEYAVEEEPVKEEPAEVVEAPVEEKPKKEKKPKAKKPKAEKKPKAKPEPVFDDDEDEEPRKRKKTQIKKVKADVETISEDEVQKRSGWVIETRELTEAEKKKAAEMRKVRADADRITREIPQKPQPVKAVRDGKKTRGERPIKKAKTQKEVKKAFKKSKEKKEFFTPDDLERTSKTVVKPRGLVGKKGTPAPRSKIERGTELGFVSTHRRSRRVVHDNQLIIKLNDEFNGAALIGKKIYFVYPDNGMKVAGSIYKVFGKKSSRKVLARFDKGIRPSSRMQKIYAK